MPAFDFFNVPRIVFGRGQLKRLGEFIPPGARPLLIYNGRPIEGSYAAKVHQRGEPTVADIDAALTIAREANCNFVIGQGGGSAIDAAKAVAGLLANGGVATDYMEVIGAGKRITKRAVPWIAIPTTAGTGAEVTRNAVIGAPEKKFKASIRSEHLMARVALIDPELGVDVPPEVTARSGADALCQCIEAYVSSGANPLTDAIALQGIELAGRYLKRVYDNGQDLEAREGMALAALIGGIALTNAGLGAVHGFAAPLGANFPIPHGAICGVLLPHVIRSNRSHGVLKYADVDKALGADAAGFCAALVEQLTLPPLASFGLAQSDIAPMVALAKRASSMRYNPVVLDDTELAEILGASITITSPPADTSPPAR
jgi:alcohol dehydrogenase class IV